MRAEIRPVRWVMPADGVVVRSLWSGLSRGTERLVASGRVPQAEHERMRAPLQEGEFPFPVKYGYCAVGLVEQGPPALLGRMVFALHPHQTRFGAPVGFVSPIPEQVPARRAILAANMETALNGLWDSGAGPGDRIAVVGAGIVGLLVAHLARGLPGTEVTVVDVDASRAGLAGALGVAFAESPPGDCDIVFHTSAAPAGLGTAIAAAGLEATVVEMSWYGEGLQPVPLGGAFHSRRLRLVSSQVGQVAPSRRPRWSHARRMEAAIGLLADDRLDALITAEVAFADLPAAVPALLAPGAPGLATAIRY
ncbi:zinc-binding alcohol dehydrogenase [uncultured Alsobacter sp.]|uniref:zinc-dependent alcohol dehydrogenase n=1 Tax=uncultured Alsobacter sp. TaxID=1748258 RepID=UPI0025F39977|nr:zinc-binding alcohol dehydrogenase [uncultured Alsobacter sp.]